MGGLGQAHTGRRGPLWVQTACDLGAVDWTSGCEGSSGWQRPELTWALHVPAVGLLQVPPGGASWGRVLQGLLWKGGGTAWLSCGAPVAKDTGYVALNRDSFSAWRPDAHPRVDRAARSPEAHAPPPGSASLGRGIQRCLRCVGLSSPLRTTLASGLWAAGCSYLKTFNFSHVYKDAFSKYGSSTGSGGMWTQLWSYPSGHCGSHRGRKGWEGPGGSLLLLGGLGGGGRA